jgi:threonine synthase
VERVVRYYSTNLRAPEVSFNEALLKGLAPDGGLYMPSFIPKIEKKDIEGFFSAEYPDIALLILSKFLSEGIELSELLALCHDAYNFSIPLENVFNRNYLMRLDRGPTASFKDFAARMMARLMNHFASPSKRHITVLTATSGDTGGAVANAFHGLENIDVIILFPVDEVTDIQRRQMTTLGGNVKVLAVDGKFDDCQTLVKIAFNDKDLSYCNLSSANSINIGRLLPQSVYYFYAWSKLAKNSSEKIIFSVPSGNYGNLMGGIIAREMGLPVRKFIIATNSNDEVPSYLATGSYKTISPSLNCISSAMNVGHPSNLARIIALYGGIMDQNGSITKEPEIERMRNDFFGISVSDDDTRDTISRFYRRFHQVLEPHGAVAWKGLEEFHKIYESNFQLAVSLETAHPGKFNTEVSGVLGFSPPIPDNLNDLLNMNEDFIKIENYYERLKEYILKL